MSCIKLGITGGMGSGKSVATQYFKDKGAFTIDADAISRELTASGGEALPAIREEFGDTVFALDGSLDRRALAYVIFNDVTARRRLEAIIHPRVQRVTIEAIEKAEEEGYELCMLDVPLLFETGMDALCDYTLVITADLETRIQRVMERDNLPREAVVARIDNQLSDEERIRRASFVISNDQTLEKLYSELYAVYNKLHR